MKMNDCGKDSGIILKGNPGFLHLKEVQRPPAFAVACFCYFDFHTVSYSGSSTEQFVDFARSMLVFVLPLIHRSV